MANLKQPIYVVGLSVRTSNENQQSFQDIPALWGKFMSQGITDKVKNKLNDNIYVVYTNFEHEGVNNSGMYTTYIGCAVAKDDVEQPDLVSTMVPAGEYRHFAVADNNPENVGPEWQKIWAMPAAEKANWSFKAEYECYHANGEIDIFIGLR